MDELRLHGLVGGKKPKGDAVAANVLATKRFSSESGIDLVGTMPNRAGDNTALATAIAGNVFKLRPPAGYYDGVDDMVTHADANRIASNIRQGVTLDGVAGSLVPSTLTAGENVVAMAAGNANNNNIITPAKAYEFNIGYAGAVRVEFGFSRTQGSGTSYARIYKNGTAVGTLRSSAADNNFVTYNEDISVAAGDLIAVYHWCDGGSNWHATRDMKIKISNARQAYQTF